MDDEKNPYAEPNHNILYGLLKQSQPNPYEEPSHNMLIEFLRKITGMIESPKQKTNFIPPYPPEIPPPNGILDNPYRKYGDKVLRDFVFKVNPLVPTFGHIHGEYGYHFENQTNFINCAVSEDPFNPIFYFDFPVYKEQ